VTVHAFVDETKHRGFVMVAAVVHPRDLAATRTTMRRLCLPGQPRLHFQKEQRGRRAEIAAAVARSLARLDVYDARAIDNLRIARTACLQRIATNLVAEAGHRLVVEQDDSLIRADRADLYAALKGLNDDEQLSYEHVPARSEPLLWIADAAAWCWTHGVVWQDRIRDRVGTVYVL